ncbi:hypothetical protein ACFOHS_03995 [Jhaorihella thermophila]
MEQRVHTVHSLARKTGDHPKTINRAVIAAGLCEETRIALRRWRSST